MHRHPRVLMRTRVACGCAAAFFVACLLLTAGSEPLPQQKGFIAALMLCALVVALAAFGRLATALVVSGGLFLALQGMSALKLRYLDEQLLPADFVYFARSSLLDTLHHYPHLLTLGLVLGVLLPLVLVLTWRWDWRVFADLTASRRFVWRGACASLGVLAFCWCMLPSGPFAQVHARNAWEKLSDDARLTNFFVSFRDAAVHLPPMSDPAVAARQWRSGTITQAPLAAAAYPDIVQVLEESTFNPSNFDACSVPACRVAMQQADARTRGTGLLRTHTFGGGTWVSEFATLTGMPQDIFGPGGMYAPYVLAPHMRNTLPQALHRLGYRTIAIYPTAGSFINGRNAYTAYGFDHLYDVNELGLIEWKESDKQIFDAAKRVYDKVKKPGQPVFMMILTLNQHGPHDAAPMSALPRPYRNLLHGLNPALALNFDTYLMRLHQSDRAMRGLERNFLDRAQPTVLVHFGDHQPAFNGMIRNLDRRLPPALQPYRDYLTYYMIKSNVAGAPLPTYPMLDIAFLPSMVLDAAGLPEDPYFLASRELRERCNGLYEDCTIPGLLASYYAWTFGHLHVYQ